MNSKDVYYGDIGVRFEKQGNNFVVQSKNPLYPKQSLKVGDKILKINGKKVYSLKQLNQTVLFAKPKTTIAIELQRGNKILKEKMLVTSRSGGGYLSDSFLENKGIFFDDKMKITKINKKSFGEISGLKIGDELMQIDHQKIVNANDLKAYLSKTKNKEVQLLFNRDDFQFFVKLGL